VATIAVAALLEDYGQYSGGIEFELYKTISPGSGLGTSASSSSGAVFAVNELLGSPYSIPKLVEFAMEGEKAISGKAHADNVAPALMGGFVAVRGYQPIDLISIAYPEDLHVAIIHPQVEVKTRDAKKMLKSQLNLSEATTQWGNVAGLVTGLSTGNYELIGRSVEDVVAEPVRSMLIPYYEKIKKKALNEGAFGCNIAGSGPSVFAFSNSMESAEKLKKAMLSVYKNGTIKALGFTSRVGKKGVRVL
jgi:homoserine kinase